jgi:hypothetical protein
MQSGISDYPLDLKILNDLTVERGFLNNVGPNECIRFFFLASFLSWKEPVERER